MDGTPLPFPEETPPARGTDARGLPVGTRNAAAGRGGAEGDRAPARTPPPPSVLDAPHGTAFAGTIPLPFHAPPQDPARIGDARARRQPGVPRRVVECVACEYRKLETRLAANVALPPDPGNRAGRDAGASARPRDAATGEPDRLPSALRRHVGTGEREYTLCQLCFEANGRIHPTLYRILAARAEREDAQRSFRHDPTFARIAERVAALERWRRDGRGDDDLLLALAENAAPATEPAGRADDEAEYDGTEADERVARLSDFTDQTPGEGRSRHGHGDPAFTHHDAQYDPVRIGADEVAAHLADEEWTARRALRFRAAWDRTGDIADEALRREVRERLIQRWDPRMALSEENRMVEASPLAPRSGSAGPWSRAVTHSGVDEGLAGEPEWKRRALARHEAAVERFLAEAREKLAQQRVPPARIQELTTLPDLNPAREIGKLVPTAALHARVPQPPLLLIDRAELPEGRAPTVEERVLALRRFARPNVLAPAAALDAVVREAEAARRREPSGAGVAAAADAGREPGADADSFLSLAHRAREGAELMSRVQALDARREDIERWAAAVRRVDVEVSGAARAFAAEMRLTFRDPEAFQRAWTALDSGDRRRALEALRERPAAFAREFGPAGELATGRRSGSARVSEIERHGVRTAEAGERYLDAVRARAITARHAAAYLGLEPGAKLADLRAGCARHLAGVEREKGAILRERDSLGPIPTPRELEHAFTGLRQPDRRHVLQRMPDIEQLLGDPHRARSRPGISL